MQDKFLNNYHINFENLTDDSLFIKKNIPKVYNNFTLSYKAFALDKGELKKINQTFLVDGLIDTLNLFFDVNKFRFKETLKNNYVNKIIFDYEKIRVKNFKNNGNKNNSLRYELDSIYSYHKKIINNKNTISKLNEINYYNMLEILNPNSIKVDSYLIEVKQPLASKYLGSLLFNYTKNRINTFDYDTLTINSFSKSYLNLLTKGLYSFLKHEDNKGDKKYTKALNWLKTTNFYKNDSVFIKKEITPLNEVIFKEKLKKIILFDKKGLKKSLSNITKKHPSSYYLIDFWATWCAPCVGGVKLMNKMNLPKNIKVISISLDKPKDKEKWKSKTEELKQLYTYWLDEDSTDGKSFLKFIELKSIPRYILIDKNLNLIDQAFYHPSEIQFLSKLKDIQNHKYW